MLVVVAVQVWPSLHLDTPQYTTTMIIIRQTPPPTLGSIRQT